MNSGLVLFRLSIIAAATLVSTAVAGQALQVEVKALDREQVRAFYSARGFSAVALKPYADACILAFTLRNDTTTTMSYRLADWKAGDIPFTAVEIWDERWAKAGVPQPARIAFRWAQLPPEQEFSPGDWIMGMAALSARPKGPFRLTVRYQDDKEQHEFATESLRCTD